MQTAYICNQVRREKKKRKKRVQYYIHRYIVGKGNNKREKQPIQVKLVIEHKNVYQSGSAWVQIGISLLHSPSYSPKCFLLRWMLQQSELGTLIKRNLYKNNSDKF